MFFKSTIIIPDEALLDHPFSNLHHCTGFTGILDDMRIRIERENN